MSGIALESLELTDDELQRAREAIRQMAYDNWLMAGMPSGDGIKFWAQAEREWIEHCYVPHRAFEFEEAPKSQ